MVDPDHKKIQRETALHTGQGPKAWDMSAESGDIDLTAQGPFAAEASAARFGYVLEAGTLNVKPADGADFDFASVSLAVGTWIPFACSTIYKSGSTATVMFLW